MANTVYENSVLEAKLTELMDSKIQVRGLMTVDDSLTQNAGLTKTVNRYTYSGTVETLESGEANSSIGELTFVPEEYTVKRYQQTFRYNDMEVMKDPSIIDMALSGLADVMANQIRGEYFEELMRADGRHPFAGDSLSYGDIVDALGEIGREVEDGLFIIMSAECRANIRRDPDFSAARQGEVIYTGQFGTLCGSLRFTVRRDGEDINLTGYADEDSELFLLPPKRCTLTLGEGAVFTGNVTYRDAYTTF